ncbi:MAG: protein kinase [Actinomycetales bacterium]|nr:protein kinase [Actinomycetales bacterium]
MKPAIGIALDDRYRLERKIAVGGMGEVWVAHDVALARDVAVKVLREEFAGDPGFLERFRTEARNAARLAHPNIAQPYDYGEVDGSGYIVMELVPGEPMSDLLAREPVLPLDRLLPILAQTARALHAAHVAGVVHRDVKPGNILLGPGGRVKITDFGVSLASNQISLTATGMVMGTAQYLSPEQALGRPATPSSDIYSLGIVAYEALAGNRPFTGESAVDIAVAHVNRPVPPLPRRVDSAMADLVMRMLAKDVAERPRSAASLARTFDEMVSATPAGGIPVVGMVTAGLATESGVSAVSAVSVVSAESPPTPAPGEPVAPGSAGSGTTGPPSEGAVVVPSSAEFEFAPSVVPAPPTYPPRRALREAPRPARLITKQRVGITWPLLVLVLLLLAVLGAAVADRMSKAVPSDTAPSSMSAAIFTSSTEKDT